MGAPVQAATSYGMLMGHQRQHTLLVLVRIDSMAIPGNVDFYPEAKDIYC